MSAEDLSSVASHPLPEGLAVFRRLLAVVGRAELVLAIIALVIVVVLSTAQAFLRYFFGTSLWWAQEVAENTIMVSYFLGISYVFKTRQEIYVEFLSSMMPIRLQLVLYMLEQLLALGFTLALLWLVWLFAPTLFNMQTPILKVPVAVTYGPLVFATVMIGLTSIYYFFYGIWSFRRGPAPGRRLTEIEEQGLILRPWVPAQ